MENSIPEMRAKFMCMCVLKKQFWISCDHFKVYKKSKSNSKRILNLQNFLPKHPFSVTLGTVLKMANEIN